MIKPPFASRRQQGFTLIELMVVIVIVSILASLIVMNIGGVDQRKAMQAREILMLDLKRANREANDQGRIYALNVSPATDVSPFGYGVVEYRIARPNAQQTRVIEQNKWKEVPSFELKPLPDQVSFIVTPQDHQYKSANNVDLIGNNTPQLIWFGNGEVKPVTIQMYYQQKPVGGLINIDYLGKVSNEE